MYETCLIRHFLRPAWRTPRRVQGGPEEQRYDWFELGKQGRQYVKTKYHFTAVAMKPETAPI